MLAQGKPSASEICAKLNAVVEDGSALTRMRMNVGPSASTRRTVLQIQVKARRSNSKTDVVYQLLWPTNRRGEAFVVSKSDGKSAGGSTIVDGKTASLGSSDLLKPFFGTDLAYVDVVENFFRWKSQAITGEEKIGRTNCLVLESKPGSGDSTPYGKVKSWIDPEKLVPMRVEKYSKSGQLVRRIDTDRVTKDDKGRHIPMNLSIRQPGSKNVTEIEGAKIRHDVKFSDNEFTADGLSNFKTGS